MALHPPQPRGGNAALTLASAGDRVRAFKSARRHSFLVRVLKLVLPLGVILSVGGYVGLLVLNNTMTVAGIESQPPVIDTKNLTMRTPRYSGTTADGSPFTVRAREAVTDLKMSGPVRLNSIDGEIRQLSGPVTNLKATWGTYDTKTEVLELFEKIDIDGSTGMRARLTRATVHVKQNLIVSTEPVTADNETGTIRANSMTLLTKARQATFKDDVRVRLKPNAASTDPAKAAAKAKATPVTGLTANSGEPIDIKSEQLDVDDTAKTALFRRSVVARQGDATLESQELDVLYEGRASIEDPKPAVKSEVAAPEQQSRLKSVTARGNVVMVNKDDRATSETMEFDASTERVTLGGGVTLNSGTERRATARQAMLDQKADTALLTGDVFVEQARNQLKGGRLFVDRRQGKTRLDSPSGLATPAGRINALFYQGTPKSGAPAKEKAEEAPVNPLGATFKTDPTQPIVIDADTLDVTDAAKTAVFKVNVIAKQGDFTVRTSELTAHYTGQALAMAPGGTPPATKTAASAAAPATQLTRIEARQKVHITGRDGQTATSDWADFDVQANTVTMGGTVVVSQGKNVATGSRFVIDLTTGLSRFVQVPGDKPAPPAAGGWAPVAPGPVPVATPKAPAGAGGPAISAAETGTSPTCPPGVVCKSNRPSMVVYPNEMKDAAKQKSKDAGADPASAPNAVRKVVRPATGASSWDATTEPRTERRP